MQNEFKDIVRDGISVPAELQKLWAVELELFEVFKKVCEKHSLKYYASGGTLLGAVRHKGPCTPTGDLPDMGIKPSSLTSPALAGGFLTTTSTTYEAPN